MERKRTRYDWKKLKAEFLSSQFQSVQERIRERKSKKTVNRNGNVAEHTKGRAEEKQKLKSQALEQAKSELKELYKPSIEELSKMHQTVIQLISAKLEKMLMEGGSMQDLAKIWEILKIEKGEPTKYVQQESKTTITPGAPTDEEMEKIQSLLSSSM